MGIPVSRIYQISTFYKAFNLTPQGRHRVRVCLGTACHVRGGSQIMEAAERLLGVKDGEVTPDGGSPSKGLTVLDVAPLDPSL